MWGVIREFRSVVIVVTVISLVGCTTLRELPRGLLANFWLPG